MKIAVKYSVIVLVAVMALLTGAGVYFLGYSLDPEYKHKYNDESTLLWMKEKYPDLQQWIDSVYPCLHRVEICNAAGVKLNGYYAFAPEPTSRTAVILHGYKSRALMMLHIGYLFNHSLGYNVLLPDLQHHGHSGGSYVQMGWDDRKDVLDWLTEACRVFGDSTQIVVTGISMGGACTMMVSGEQLPDNVKCFVEDCGYTSVWDEFKGELDKQFSLPAFPLLHYTSGLCKMLHGWSFTEASSLEQVRRCNLPMMFIHGDDDDFVPTAMVYRLYDAKSGEKELYISKGSAHALSYRDHPREYTDTVRQFVGKYIR